MCFGKEEFGVCVGVWIINYILRVYKGKKGIFGFFEVYFGYFNLVFYYFGFVTGRYISVFEVGGDDVVGNIVELGDGGTDGGS